MKLTLIAAGSLGMLSVVMGAVGGHDGNPSWMTAVTMGLVHALAALIACILSERTPSLKWAARGFVLGGYLFGASIWVKTLVWGVDRASVDNAERSFVEILVALAAPLGGMTLILSWAMLTAVLAISGRRPE